MILRQRGLAGAGRPPEDERADIVALDLRAQRLARTDQVLLADEFIERPRTHAVGQRASAVAGVFAARDGWKQTHAAGILAALVGRTRPLGGTQGQRQDVRAIGACFPFCVSVPLCVVSLPLPCNFVQHDTRRHPSVQRLHLRRLRDGHDLIHFVG